MKEEWRIIEESKGKLEVSDHGKIRSTKKGRILKLQVKDTGYHTTLITNPDTKKKSWVGVHRVVARAFIPNPNNLPQVRHKNHDRADNRVENLEWGSPEDNGGDKFHRFRGNPLNQLNKEQKEEVLKFLKFFQQILK